MTINEYQKLAMTTLNPELTKKDVMINSVMEMHRVFGIKEDAEYFDREGAYLIPYRNNQVGVVQTPTWLFLPRWRLRTWRKSIGLH